MQYLANKEKLKFLILRHALVKVSMGPGKQNSQQEVEQDTVEGDVDSEVNTSEDV